MCVGVEGLCVLVSKVVCVEGLCECWKLVGVFGFGRLIGCVGAKEQNSTGLERFLLFSTIVTCSEAFKSSSTTEDNLSSKTNVS